MKVSGRDKLLLVGLLGILSVVCSCFLVFWPTMEKADALETENERLQAEITNLTIKMESKDSYMADTEQMKQEIAAVYQRFPVDVREEDGILLAVNQEQIAPMMIDSINISGCEPVVLPESSGEDESSSLLMKRNMTIHYLVSYDGLKRSIRNIGAQDNRISIQNLAVAYDESTGLLRGTTSVDMYCVPGQPGKEYVQPGFSSVLVGTDNIFGSLESYGRTEVKEDTGDGEEEEEEGTDGTEEP